MIVNDELERTWKEVEKYYLFYVISWRLPDRIEGSHEKAQSRLIVSELKIKLRTS
jgi:hypothetical protein